MDESSFEDRSEIEGALNAQLRPAALGSVVRDGTRLRYSYIELALTGVDAAWSSIQSVL